MAEPAPRSTAILRELPSVERLAATLDGRPRTLAVAAAREEIAAARQRILNGEQAEVDEARLQRDAKLRLRRLGEPSLRRVINATGVVLHTNLGRAPLAPEAAEAAAAAGRHYTNLELDLQSGERGSRGAHVEPLLRELTGAEAALAVNNNAAAVLLAVAATAAGREVIVSRGELVEIGGSFRIPEIVEVSGAELVEVGTTNRTRIADYESAIGPGTAAILRVHQSNFRTVGFTEAVPARELAELAGRHGIALIDDLGSGAIAPAGDEPLVRGSLEAGATLVCCSADKLLGGPQAGLLLGAAETVQGCRAHPLARALRLDSLQLAGLEATLRLHRDAPERIPALAMLAADPAELERRAGRLAELIGAAAEVTRDASRPGGGTLPLLEIEGPVCALRPGPIGADGLVAALRAAEPPVIARVSQGMVLLDPRTLEDSELQPLAAAVRAALEG